MFQLPEDRSKLSIDELRSLLTEAIAAQRELAALSDDDLTDEKLDELETVQAATNTLGEEIAAIEATEQARLDRVAAAKAAVPTEDDEPPVEEEPAEEPVEPEDEPIDDVVIPDDASALTEEKELVTASGKSVVARAARKQTTTAPEEVEIPLLKPASIIAAANVPSLTAGEELSDFVAVADAFAQRAKGFGGGPTGKAKKLGNSAFGLSDSAQRFGLVRIQRPENEFTTGMEDSAADQMAVILAAAREDRLPGGSLVAAGGWCAPSETIYGPFCSLETISGILSLPEVTITRGGINFTKGPDYGTLAASWGFLQTEAQAEAGTVKVCYEVECPPFTDVRLDAVGFCITNGVLTNVGYPELGRRVLEIGAVAHAHKVNASVISRIATAVGAAIDYTELGGGVTDLLGGIETAAEVIRYKYAMEVGASIEVILPAWARVVARQDFANRNGNVTDISPTDAEVTRWFTDRGLAVQWVYDWQSLPTSGATVGQALPATVNAILYPAGAFVKGVSPVIDLDTIYDSVGLSTNTYTAAFFEEGLLVANTCAGGLQVAIALNTEGASGYPAIGAPVA